MGQTCARREEPASHGRVPNLIPTDPHHEGNRIPISSDDGSDPGERIAIIGAGATGTYALHSLTRDAVAREVVVFESSAVAGPGLAYAEHLNDAHALANIAGVEVPPLIDTLNQWALRQSRSRLETWGIADSAGDDRAFFPRVVLGAWLADQFAMIARRSRIPVTVRLQAEVVDIVAMPHGCRLDWRSADGDLIEDHFDRVIVASGYGPITTDEPTSAMRTGKAAADAARSEATARFGVLGSSLSAVDAVVAIAMARGTFVQHEDALIYVADHPWHAEMLSRNGLLPEADFWFPYPLPDLPTFTPETAAASVHGKDGDLDRLFNQFAWALRQQAPEWSESIGLCDATADDFADRYFAARSTNDPWHYARENLVNVRAWQDNHRTPSWRIAILKAHEVFAAMIPSLSTSDVARLHRGLKRVFTDNYAAVPHLSIERILALHDAGILDVIAIGDDYDIRPRSVGRWLVHSPDWSAEFDELIDARGPQAAALDHFPFPTLRMQLCAHALEDRQDWKSGINPSDDLTLGDQDLSLRRVHLCALPFLLRNRPFVQGLVECAEMARAVSRAALDNKTSASTPTTSTQDLLDLLKKPSVILPDGAVLALAGPSG